MNLQTKDASIRPKILTKKFLQTLSTLNAKVTTNRVSDSNPEKLSFGKILNNLS